MKLTLPLERSLPKLLDRLSDTEYTKKKRTRQIIFQDPLVRSSSSNLSPQKRRERKWRKEACKLLPNYLGLLADKRGHCFRDPVRISVSQRDDKMSQFQPALARIKLPPSFVSRNETWTCPDSGHGRACGPEAIRRQITEKRLATRPISLADPRANNSPPLSLRRPCSTGGRGWNFESVPLIVACPRVERGERDARAINRRGRFVQILISSFLSFGICCYCCCCCCSIEKSIYERDGWQSIIGGYVKDSYIVFLGGIIFVVAHRLCSVHRFSILFLSLSILDFIIRRFN